MDEFYTVGKWHGRPNYRCNHCRKSTLSRDEMEAHVQVHMRQLNIRPNSAGLVTASGEPMVVVEEEDPPEPPHHDQLETQRGEQVVESVQPVDDDPDESHQHTESRWSRIQKFGS